MNGVKKDTEQFIAEARLVHGDKYDYSKTEYVDWKTKICIICPVHGEFWQIANSHLQGFGCKKCSNLLKSKKMTFGKDEFINKAKKKHGSKYDYSKVIYENYWKRVCIICPEHGEFWQTPRSHLCGRGCPICGDSMLEKNVAEILTIGDVTYERQKTFDWLGKKSLDFYLPEYNVAIECQGEQHYKPVEYFGGEETFNDIIERDICKNRLCREHNISLLYYSEKRDMFLDELTVNKNNLLNIIENGNKN